MTMEMPNHLDLPIGFAVPNWTPPPRPSRTPMLGTFCRIEPLAVDRHASDLYRANAADTEGRLWIYLPYGPFDSLESYANWMRDVCDRDDPLFYAIVDRATDTAVGVASYLRIAPESGTIEVGHINYSPALQRTPAATEAMYLMMKQAFELGYRRYEWKFDILRALKCADSPSVTA
jgi:RimJ/RimL family protein N-acetyltransferase